MLLQISSYECNILIFILLYSDTYEFSKPPAVLQTESGWICMGFPGDVVDS